MHTTASDGRITPPELGRLAAAAGVEVVVLTDHDRVSPGAGWHSGTLMVAGQEVTPRHNHLLVLGLDQPLPKFRGDGLVGDPALSLSLAARRGGWSVLAHPLDPGAPLFRRSRAFVSLDFAHLDHAPGLELWNTMSAFKEGLDSTRKGLGRVFLPQSTLAPPNPLLLKLWDGVGRGRRWVALGGADAHAFSTPLKWLPIRVYSYRKHLKLITTGLWLEAPLAAEAEAAAGQVLAALAAGRCFAALGPARGFACWLEDARGRRVLPGAELAWEPGWRLNVRLPARGWLKALVGGRTAATVRGRELSLPLGSPGVWRVEAWRRRPPWGRLMGGEGSWRPWIFCNPFYLRDRP